MPDLFLKKVGDAFVPDGDESIAVFDKIGQLKVVHCEVKQQRSIKHHRLFFALLHRVVNYLDRDDIDTDKVLLFLKKATGLTGTMHTKTFGNIDTPGSISFSKMEQITFRDWFEKCVRFIIAEWGIPYEVFGDMLGEIGTEKRGG